MSTLDVLIPLLAKIAMVALFPPSALEKILDWSDTLKQARSSILPGGAVLLVLGIVIELGCPASILLGWHDRIGAVILAAFCAATALLYKPFWAHDDFWRRGKSLARMDFWDFLKNFAVAGGLVLFAISAGPLPMVQLFHEPLSSVPSVRSGT